MNTFLARSSRCLRVASLAAMLVLAPRAWPQTTVGAVSGTVRDQSGAVIPNASVVLTNTATNVNVAVAERVVINAVMIAGQVSTSVQVGDVTPLVATDNPTVSSTLENQRINQLPINGRDIRNLLATIPEMESFRVFGTTGDSIEWVLNGAVITDRRWCCGPATDALLDSLQEFTVESNAVSAKMAHPVSLLMVTKNGTNTLHGTAFDTLGIHKRRNVLDDLTESMSYRRDLLSMESRASSGKANTHSAAP